MSSFRRRLFNNTKDPFDIGKNNAKNMDYVLFSKKTNDFVFITRDILRSDNFKSVKDDYSPIGIIILDSTFSKVTHGNIVILALDWMSLNTPDTGSKRKETMYAYSQTQDFSFRYDGRVPYLIKNTKIITRASIGLAHSANMPSPAYRPDDIDLICNHDSVAGYALGANKSSLGLSLYRYINENSNELQINELLYSTDFDGINLFDINIIGLELNKAMINAEQYQSDWKTSSTILNADIDMINHFPAALCCWRYSTLGTNKGNWRIPTLYELNAISYNRLSLDDRIDRLSYTGYDVGLSDFYPMYSIVPTCIWNDYRFYYAINGNDGSAVTTINAYYKCNVLAVMDIKI